MTAEQLEREFGERGIARGGILFLRSDIALDLVHRARDAEIRVLGVDGFILSGDTTQPSLEHSLDLSGNRHQNTGDSWKAASEFLQPYAGKDLYFEVVLE